jgi:hypothetical protein
MSHEWWLVVLTGILAAITGALAWYTARLYRATVHLGADAKTTANEHGSKMVESIAEASRAATAQEGIAKATIENALLMQGVMHKQMRAYVSVEFAGAIYQDENLRFQLDVSLTNSGFTPAKEIGYVISADLLPELPDNFAFPHLGPRQNNDATLAPRQSFTVPGTVRHRIPPEEADQVMRGEGRRLYAWGTVYYKDIFGNAWTTDFCQSVTFRKWVDTEGKDRVSTPNVYHPTHNSST